MTTDTITDTVTEDATVTEINGRRNASMFTPAIYEQVRNLVDKGKKSIEIASIIGCTHATLKVMCSRKQISLRGTMPNGVNTTVRRPSAAKQEPTMAIPPVEPATVTSITVVTAKNSPILEIERQIARAIAKHEQEKADLDVAIAALKNQLIGVAMARKALT